MFRMKGRSLEVGATAVGRRCLDVWRGRPSRRMGLVAGEDEGHGGDVWVCDVRDKVLLFGMLHKRCGQMREVRMRGAQD